MLAVVTGSSGFIGSHLVDALLAAGASVRALVRPQSRTPRNIAGVSYFEADLLDRIAVRSSPVWDGATHVFHLAGVTTANSRRAFDTGNVRPLESVLAAVGNRATAVRRVVVVSSQAAGGPALSESQAADGSSSVAPVEWYGESKLAAERIVLEYAGTLPVCIVRPSSVYGPRDLAFLTAFRQAVRPVALYAVSQTNRIELVHVSDVVRAILSAAVNDVAIGKRYTVTGASSVSWRELYAEVSRAAGLKSVGVTVPSPLMRLLAIGGDVYGLVTQRTPLINSQKLEMGRQPFWIADGSAIRRELSCEPMVALRDGVRDTYLWYVGAGLLRARGTARKPTLVGQDATH